MGSKFRIFNKSSENMSEVRNRPVDLVVMDPPYNIGLVYGQSADKASQESYFAMIQEVISQAKRLLKPEGILLTLLPEMIRRQGRKYYYPEIYDLACSMQGLYQRDVFSFRVTEQDSNCFPLSELERSTSLDNIHSQEMRGQVFGMLPIELKHFPKNRNYNYKERETHPCPYPKELISDILDTFFVPGYTVLEPFMGTAGLGEEVLRRGGTYFGYEIAKLYFDIAKNKLSKIGEEIK